MNPPTIDTDQAVLPDRSFGRSDRPNATPVLLGSALASAALSACGGGGGGSASTTPATGGTSGASAVPASDAEAVRFLLQTQLSAADEEIAALRSTSYAAWLDAQMAQPSAVSGWDWLTGRGYGEVDAAAYYDASYPSDFMVWNQLMTAPDPLRRRVALALSEIFVVSLASMDVNWRSHALASYWDMLAGNAFGNYRKLLEDVTLHPAMGYYLNTRGNQKENAATGRQPDENYAREVLQLMSIGLVQLNGDGSPKLDATGAKTDTYSQSDITNLARVFTGYDFDQSQNSTTLAYGSSTRVVGNPAYTRLPMAFKANLHSTLAASFLGVTIPANTAGPEALKTALDTIFNHPNVGPFIGKQLIQRLVTSNPSAAYVGRVAAAFNNNGAGVRGDLRAVLKAIWLDDEARGSAGLSQPGFGKLREPMLRFVQWGRTFGLQSAYGTWKITDLSSASTALGQSPLRSPSVFNFFRPGYVPPSTALAASGAVAPEFQLVNESSVGGYLNFMQSAIRNGIWVGGPNVPNHYVSNATDGFDLKAGYTRELALVTDADALVARVNLLLTAGQLSAATVKLISDALKATNVTAASSANAKLERVCAAVFLVMASAEYLIQK